MFWYFWSSFFAFSDNWLWPESERYGYVAAKTEWGAGGEAYFGNRLGVARNHCFGFELGLFPLGVEEVVDGHTECEFLPGVCGGEVDDAVSVGE